MLNKDTLLTEAMCGRGDLLLRSNLTEQERLELRAGEMKVRWLEKMMPRGLTAQIAFEGGESIGFIEYMPIELSNRQRGSRLYTVNCMVAPHTPPWGTARRERIPGCGSGLVNAMVEDVKDRCDGIVAPNAIAYTQDLKGFFAKLGFDEFENKGLKKLIKKFRALELPEPVRYENRYKFRPLAGKVVVDAFWSSMCRALPHALLNLREVCGEADCGVVLNEFRVDEREDLERYGVDGVTYFNGKWPHYSYQLFEKETIRNLLKRAKEEDETAQL